ncbi:hypothetical protein BJ165DRAFT_396780 [Panaeolus papilionaceus]|nr:hypothetical protein BJ165DRAFT_396780 [Panaeolus papilionaceus]
MIQAWYEEQLENLVHFELLPRVTCRMPRLLSRLGNPRSLSSLRSLTYTSLSPRAVSWYINSRQDEELSLFLSTAKALTKLEIINTLTHTLQLPTSKPNNHSQLAIHTLIVRDTSYLVLTAATLASLTPSLTSLHVEFFQDSIAHPISTSMVSMGNTWTEIQPQHLKNLRSLSTNGLCQNLMNRLSDPSYFVSLCILKLDFRGLSYLHPHPMTDMADGFFSNVVPALAERGIEELEIYHACDCTPWSFRERDSAQYDGALKIMKRLARFAVSVGVDDSDKDALSLVEIAHQHPFLRTLQIEVAKMSNCNAVLSRPITSARYIESDLQHFARAGNPADYPRVFLPGVLFEPYSIDNIVLFGVTYLSD